MCAEWARALHPGDGIAPGVRPHRPDRSARRADAEFDAWLRRARAGRALDACPTSSAAPSSSSRRRRRTSSTRARSRRLARRVARAIAGPGRSARLVGEHPDRERRASGRRAVPLAVELGGLSSTGRSIDEGFPVVDGAAFGTPGYARLPFGGFCRATWLTATGSASTSAGRSPTSSCSAPTARCGRRRCSRRPTTTPAASSRASSSCCTRPGRRRRASPRSSTRRPSPRTPCSKARGRAAAC